MHTHLLSTVFVLALSGCLSSTHQGNLAAEQGDWHTAYTAYETAHQRRPSAETPRRRLNDARVQVLRELDASIQSNLNPPNYVAVGEFLRDAHRYRADDAWISPRHQQITERIHTHTDTILASEGPAVAARMLGEAYRDVGFSPEVASMEERIRLAAAAAARSLEAKNQFQAAHRLLQNVSTTLPSGEGSLAPVQQVIEERWAISLHGQAADSTDAGAFGAATLYTAAANALDGTPAAQNHKTWMSVLSQEWGGLYLRFSGPRSHVDLASEAVIAKWHDSVWRAAPIAPDLPTQPHLGVVVSLQDVACRRTQEDSVRRIHEYTDGTFVTNPEFTVWQQAVAVESAALAPMKVAAHHAKQTLRATSHALEETKAIAEHLTIQLPASQRQLETAKTHLSQSAAQVQDATTAQQQVSVFQQTAQELSTEKIRLTRTVTLQQQTLQRAEVAQTRAETAQSLASEATQKAQVSAEDAATKLAALMHAQQQAQLTLESTDLLELEHQLSEQETRRDRRSQRLETAEAAHVAAVQARAAAAPEALEQAIAAEQEANQAENVARAALEKALAQVADTKHALDALQTQQAVAQQQLEAATSAIPDAQTRVTRTAAVVQRKTEAATIAAQTHTQTLEQVETVRADHGKTVQALNRLQQKQTQLEAALPTLQASAAQLPTRTQAHRRAIQGHQDATLTFQHIQQQHQAAHAQLQQATTAQNDAQTLMTRKETAYQEQATLVDAFRQSLGQTPPDVELVKQQPYTAVTWLRTCVVDGRVQITGIPPEGWEETLHLEAVESDVTWTGDTRVGLVADPLQFAAEDEAVLANKRVEFVAEVWRQMGTQLRRDAETLRVRSGTLPLEDATCDQLVAHWMAPSTAMGDFVRQHYSLPPLTW